MFEHIFSHQVVWIRHGLTFGILLLICGCSEINLLSHVAKKIGEDADQTSSDVTYKVGKPYEINGVWYYPKVDYSYDKTGIASWYGPNFHGKPTANGERFDMNLVSAAHKTLPLPSFVRVTNLENGRALDIRINDRGPFVHGRIIDLSRRAAEILGVKEKGIAKVRVTILADKSRKVAERAGAHKQLAHNLKGGDGEKEAEHSLLHPVTRRNLNSPGTPPSGRTPLEKEAEDKPHSALALLRDPSSEETPILNEKTGQKTPLFEQKPVIPSFMYIQAGAFLDLRNANKLKHLLQSFGQTNVTPATIGENVFYQVRVGPLQDMAEADSILEQIIRSGHSDARITVIERTPQ